MNFRSWAKTQLAGLLFIGVGLMNLLTADLLLGVVWALLGASLIAYEGSHDAAGRATRGFEPTPRNFFALAAALLALALLAIAFLGGGG
ncbi:MAG: hypothetical protein AAGU78_11225 [Chloroflexota bacterium]|jgi:hypothetical protein|nr:hypothetical protein [Anaerolineae bacterium]HMM27350.1 hypothetical protein [Aggregatilineaceae bacterium]